MPIRIAIVVLLMACADALAASDLYETVNRLRAGEGPCTIGQKVPALTRQDALDRAARSLAHGVTLRDSLQAAGYRATRTVFFSMKGEDVGRAAGSLLEEKYCAQVADAALADMGVYQDGRQIWIVLAAPFSPRVAMSTEAAGQRVLELVNRARAESRRCGSRTYQPARPVRWNESLARAALAHAQDMARHDYFSHEGRDGSTPAQRVERAGYAFRSTGENIAGGQSTPEDAVARWIASPTHCATLMQPAYTEMGAGFAVDRNSEFGVYWTQVFGTPR